MYVRTTGLWALAAILETDTLSGNRLPRQTLFGQGDTGIYIFGSGDLFRFQDAGLAWAAPMRAKGSATLPSGCGECFESCASQPAQRRSASTAFSTSDSSVAQSATEIRMYRFPFHVVPLKNAVPSAWTRLSS